MSEHETPAPVEDRSQSSATLTRGERSTWLRDQLHGGITALLILALVVVANYLGFRHYARWDLTRGSVYSLSEASRRAVARLRSPVTVFVFLSEAEPNYVQVKELLERYRAAARHLTVRFVDPDRRPSEFRVLAQRFGLATGQLESGETVADVAAVLTSKSKRWTITRDDLLGYDLGGTNDRQGPKLQIKAEQALTSAIAQVTAGKPSRVCVASGHGEWSLEAGGERSLAQLGEDARRDNVELSPLELSGASAIPRTCDAVLVVGPVRAFTEQEASMLHEYVKAGGSALLALDPLLYDERVQPTGLEAFLERVGVGVEPKVVIEIDKTKMLTPNPLEPFVVTTYGTHKTTAGLSQSQGRTAMNLVRAVEPRGRAATVLLQSSPQSFATPALTDLAAAQEPTKAPSDDAGPVSLAVAVELGATKDRAGRHGGRLIVIGDSDWLLPPFLQSPVFANVELASAWLGWLTEQQPLLSIATKTLHARPVMMTEADISGLAMRVLVFLPGAVLLLGVAVWWARRY